MQAGNTAAELVPAGPPAEDGGVFARTVHVAQWGNRAGGGRAPLIVQGAIGVAAVSLLLAYRAMHLLNMPPWLIWGVVAACVLAALAWGLVWTVCWFRRGQRIGGPSLKTDERYRVRLIGRPDKAEPLVPESADAFEPVVVFAWLAVPPSPAGYRVWVVASVAAFLVWMVLKATPPFNMNLGYWGVLACIGLGGVAAALATPTYFRVVPGRLDVMRFNFLYSRKPTLESYDLRTSRVLVDVRARIIVIEPPERPEEAAQPRSKGRSGRKPRGPVPGSIEITLICLPGAGELARAVLRGAVTAAPAPPLPDDELIG